MMKAIARARFQINEAELLLYSPLEFQVLIATANQIKTHQMYDLMDALKWHSTGLIIAQGGKKSNAKLRRHFKFSWDKKRALNRRSDIPVGESGKLEKLKHTFNS